MYCSKPATGTDVVTTTPLPREIVIAFRGTDNVSYVACAVPL